MFKRYLISKTNGKKRSLSRATGGLNTRGHFETLETRHLLSGMSLTSYDEVSPSVYIEHTTLLDASSLAPQSVQNLSAASIENGLAFNFIPSQNVQQAAIDAFEEAGRIWSSVLLDNVTVNIGIDFTALGQDVLGSTQSVKSTFDYPDVVAALQADCLTHDDTSAVSHLDTGDAIDVLINRTSDNPNGSGSATPYVDNDGDDNNSQLRITRANAKSLGLIDAESTLPDASISFSNSFTWDFDPQDGISSGAFDAVGMALHEIGHVLGFTSGVDILDINAPPINGPFSDDQFSYISTLDLFRYSEQSEALGVVDWTADNREKFFSIDGGLNSIGVFSTGHNFGDKEQASHWKGSLNLGLMDPTLSVGVSRTLKELDLRALDVIGWDKGFRVTSTADSMAIDLSGVVPAASNGKTTLRSAIQMANAIGTQRFIVLPTGTYNLTLSNTSSESPDTNDIDITGEINIIGAGAGRTIIDASGLDPGNNARVFELSGGNADVEMSSLTITGGNVNGSSGGGIFVHSGNELDLTRVAVTGNTASGRGGGVYVESAAINVRNTVIAYNSAYDSGGGLQTTNSTTTIGGTVIAGNTATTIPGASEWGFGGSHSIISYGNNRVAMPVPAGIADDLDPYTDVFTESPPDYVVTSLVDTARTSPDNNALSLREAVLAANAASGADTIWVPGWHFTLSNVGSELTLPVGSTNDLDFTDSAGTTLRGVGPGLTVIDGSGLAADGSTNAGHDRVFELHTNGKLIAERLTVTGGNSLYVGGGIRVNGGSNLSLNKVAVVNNVTATEGGGLYADPGSTAFITNSVFTGNIAGGAGGGIKIISTADIDIGTTIVVGNFDGGTVSGTGANEVGFGGTLTAFTSQGYNLFGNLPGALRTNSNDQYEVPATYVVTSVADTFNHLDDAFALSLREAIDRANDPAVDDHILLPAWNYLLTIERDSESLTDTETGYGDLEIKDTLTIQRAGAPLAVGVSAVNWREGVTDDVFELLGDYHTDLVVDQLDFVEWRNRYGGNSEIADGDEDTDVDLDDYALYYQNFGNELELINV